MMPNRLQIVLCALFVCLVSSYASAQKPVAQGCIVPTITSVDPPSGPLAGGTSVTITGTGFFSGQTSVTFGGIAATSVVVNSSTSLTAVTPPGTAPGAVDVVVNTTFCGSATLPAGFTYVAGATVPALSPFALAALAAILGLIAVVILKR